MSHVYEVLKEKEIAVERVRREIEALRLVCQLLEQADSTPVACESDSEPEKTAEPAPTVDQRAAALEQIRVRLAEERPVVTGEHTGRLLQFTRTAIRASRTIVNRVPDSPLLERESQRKTIRDLFERLARSNAA